MSKKYYIALHGAKKNVGDFLIKESAIALLKHYRPDREIITLPHWENLDHKLDLINKSEAVIFMGGPGIQPDIYPKVYPFVSNLDNVTVPVYLLGSGSYMFPYFEKEIKTYSFSDSSIRFLKKCSSISTRDLFTQQLLIDNHIDNVIMSGCPAWYQPDLFGKQFKAPKEVPSILVSTPQKKIYWEQFIQVLETTVKQFPSAKITVAFNRGFEKDQHTSQKEANRLIKYKKKIEGYPVEIVNTAYDLEKFKSFASFDLHVGYRLHSHIFFLSNRKASYIIAEDSRSFGNFTTLSLPGFSGIQPGRYTGWLPYFREGIIKEGIFKFTPPFKVDPNIDRKLKNRFLYDIKTNFTVFNNISDKIDGNMSIMKKFIKSMP